MADKVARNYLSILWVDVSMKSNTNRLTRKREGLKILVLVKSM